MAVTEIEVVELHLPSDVLLSAAIDRPNQGDSSNVYRIDMAGWALGRHSPIVAIEVYAGHHHLSTAQVDRPRTDIAEVWSETPWAARSGFQLSATLIGLVGFFELKVVALSGQGRRSPLATIRGKRAPLPSPVSQSPAPLLITTHGRSGSTWLSRLLSHHPEVFAYSPIMHETRIAPYWMEVLQTLTDPKSYFSMSDIVMTGEPHWWTGSDISPSWANYEPPLATWLGSDHVEDIARFCYDKVNALYKQIGTERIDGAAYVAEKTPPSRVQGIASDVFPQGREIILVRDFRDMMCSMVAFAAAKGGQHFGRNTVQSEDDYVHVVLGFAKSLLRSWQSRSDEALLVRYEDLVKMPTTSLDQVLHYLSVENGSAIVEQMLKAASSYTKESARHRTAPSVAASIGRWRSDLSPQLQQACENALGGILTEFGYEL